MTTVTQEPKTRREHRWEARVASRNVGGVERGARLAVGTAAAVAAFTVAVPWLRVVLGIVGLSGLFTGSSGYCPINKRIGHDSYHRS